MGKTCCWMPLQEMWCTWTSLACLIGWVPGPCIDAFMALHQHPGGAALQVMMLACSVVVAKAAACSDLSIYQACRHARLTCNCRVIEAGRPMVAPCQSSAARMT